MYTAAVITISDRCYEGEREDLSGPVITEILQNEKYIIEYSSIIPDEMDYIKTELIKCTDDLDIALVITTGGTGFSNRDVTPEATEAVCIKMTPGIPEAMRAESLKITDRAILSRQQAGIRDESLIINLPGSPKAARENLCVVLSAIKHGLDILRNEQSEGCV